MRFTVALLGLSLLSGSAFAAGPVPLDANSNAKPMYLVDGNGNPISSLGGIPATLTPFSSPTIAATNTYQQVLASGKSATQGGCAFAASSNAATDYVDPTGATGTALSTAAIPVTPGGSVCWPAITSAVTIYGTAGDKFTGSGG